MKIADVTVGMTVAYLGRKRLAKVEVIEAGLTPAYSRSVGSGIRIKRLDGYRFDVNVVDVRELQPWNGEHEVRLSREYLLLESEDRITRVAQRLGIRVIANDEVVMMDPETFFTLASKLGRRTD